MSDIELYNNSASLGKEGERKVAKYLQNKGYSIIKYNHRERFGEIDIIARIDNTIVFVEVKTRRADSLVKGFEAITPYKQERIRKTALLFMNKLELDCIIRFDAASVTVDYDNNKLVWKLEYIKNAF